MEIGNAEIDGMIPNHRVGFMPIRIRCLDKLHIALKHVHSEGDVIGNILTVEEGYTGRTRNSASYADQSNYCSADKSI